MKTILCTYRAKYNQLKCWVLKTFDENFKYAQLFVFESKQNKNIFQKQILRKKSRFSKLLEKILKMKIETFLLFQTVMTDIGKNNDYKIYTFIVPLSESKIRYWQIIA